MLSLPLVLTGHCQFFSSELPIEVLVCLSLKTESLFLQMCVNISQTEDTSKHSMKLKLEQVTK